MPAIDFADNEADADRLVNYWASKITAIGAQDIAGVTKERYKPNGWRINVEVYVPEDSAAYRDFMKRFR
jgi:hypothetical protein